MLLMRVAIRRRMTAAAAAVVLTMPAGVRAQAVVRTIVVEQRAVPVTDRVFLSRFADLAEQKSIAVNTTLTVGDLFWTPPGGTSVLLEVACPAGGTTVFRFSGSFRAVILPPRSDVPCVLQLLGGGVDVRAEGPTEINAGGIVLGSKGTQYAVYLRREKDGVVCDGVVYDDKLMVRTPASKEIELATSRGWTYDFATRTGKQGAVPEAIVRESARIATRFDLARINPEGEQAESPEARRQANELFAMHVEVLKAPANQDARARLGKAQERLGLLDAARYNLIRAGVMRQDIKSMEEIKPAAADAKAQPAKAAVRTETVAQPPTAARTEAAATTRTGGAASRSAAAAGVEPSARALDLVRAGRPAEAIALIRPRVDAGTAAARDYYALAEAYRATQDRAAAKDAADRALAAADAATVLSASEIETLRAIARGGR